MKVKRLVIYFLTGTILVSCQNTSSRNTEHVQAKAENSRYDNSIVYKTENLIIEQLTNHVYQHISFLNTNSFGRVDCNGMVVINNREAVVFDTPSNDESSEELINFLVNKLQVKIKAIIPTHFHEDCVGGLYKFNAGNIPGFASNRTIELLKYHHNDFSASLEGFADSLSIDIGGKTVYAEYFGEGHTTDNVIAYFPEDSVIFGSCLIKSLGASKGNLADANVNDWSATVRKLRQKYPEAKMVIPGHGKAGSAELLDYTIKLFE